MLTKHVQDFLDKIGVELPEPRTMEGFGTELPLPYLERCLNLIIPATESYMDSLQKEIIADFMDYVSKYNKSEDKDFKFVTAKEETVVTDTIETPQVAKVQVIEKSNTELKKDTADSKSYIKERSAVTDKVLDWFLKNPDALDKDAAKALRISRPTICRHRIWLQENGFLPPKVDKRTFLHEDVEARLPDLLKKNPSISITEVAEYFGISTSFARRMLIAAKEKDAFIFKPENDVKPEETVAKIKAESVEKKNTVVPAEKSVSAKPSSYITNLRDRINNENTKGTTAKKEPMTTTLKDVARIMLPTVTSDVLREHFNKMESEKQTAVVTSRWDIAVAPEVLVKELSNKFLSQGITLLRTVLTKLEYSMLCNALKESSLSVSDKVFKYREYLAKA